MPSAEQTNTSDNQERTAAWRHDQPISVNQNDFEALIFAGELTLRAWLEGFNRSLPVINGDERLMQEHFKQADSRFHFSPGRNAPASSYNQLLRSLENSPNKADMIRSTLKGRDSRTYTIQLADLLKTKITEIKQYYYTGHVNFSVFVNAVMIAIEEASADVALPPPDPTRS